MLYNWLKNNLLCIFSKQCLLCLGPTQNTHLICIGCESDLPKNAHCCLICSTPFASNSLKEHKLVCGQCQKSPPDYTTSIIPYLYASPLKQVISQLKFHGNLTYVPLLAHGFVSSIKSREKWPECIIPVPLHKQRLRERGFNQALELAQLVGKQLQIPLNYSLCQRNKSTPFQSGLSAKQRTQNLKNAFTVAESHQYKHVAIFDDVVTTGTTVNELAKQLKKSGVEIIEVWAIARTANKS